EGASASRETYLRSEKGWVTVALTRARSFPRSSVFASTSVVRRQAGPREGGRVPIEAAREGRQPPPRSGRALRSTASGANSPQTRRAAGLARAEMQRPAGTTTTALFAAGQISSAV